MAELTTSDRRGDQYVYGIDVVRFCAAVSVAAFHFTLDRPESVWTMPVGWIGVQVFFVISGFVIANSARGATPWRFATGRILRLYPVAIWAAAINFAIFNLVPEKVYDYFGLGGDSEGVVQLVQSVLLFGTSFLAGSYWTLPVELAFYSVIFVLLVFRGFAHLRWVAIALTVVSTPYLITLALHGSEVVNTPWIDFQYGLKNTLLVRHGPYFALGIFLWLWKQGLMKAGDWLAAAVCLILAGLEIFATADATAPFYVTPAGAPPLTGAFLIQASLLTFAVAFAVIVASVMWNAKFPASPRLRAVVRMMGLATYPYYLLHEAVGALIFYSLLSLGVPFYPGLLMALCAVGAIALFIALTLEPFLRRYMKRSIEVVGTWLPAQARA